MFKQTIEGPRVPVVKPERMEEEEEEKEEEQES